MLLHALLVAVSASAAAWPSEPLPQYDQAFQRTNGWIGADGDFTVALPNGVTLWLFSDTFVGDIRDGHREHATMVNNSAAWQHGVDPATTHVDFFVRRKADGKPASLITPADGHGWFWLYDAVLVRGKLFMFLQQIEHTKDKGAFGFRQIGTSLGEVSNPLDPPTRWHIQQQRLPFAQFTAADTRCFGSSVIVTNGFVYIFGIREHMQSGKHMILARAPEESLSDFSTWQFRTHEGWTRYAEGVADLCAAMATEYSVSWLPARQQYVLICTLNGLSDKILARTAPNPWGPWSDATIVYQCPETAWDPQNFCYSGKAHSMLATSPDKIILTYAANAYGLAHVINDPRLYWPRFVRVTVK